MDLLLNELSFQGQFNSTEDFIEQAIKPLLSILKEITASKTEVVVYKKQDFWNSKATKTYDIRSILLYIRESDEIRGFKSQLNKILIDEPYWEINQKHLPKDSYHYFFNGINKYISGTSLAEACERDKAVISVTCKEYNQIKLNIDKGGEHIIIENILNINHYNDLLERLGLIRKFSLEDSAKFIKTNFTFQGKTAYKEKAKTGYYWYLDNLHKNHYEVFDSNGHHIGEADMEGNINEAKIDKSKKIDIK